MNATNRSAARAGLVVCSVLAVALTGCRTHVVHERTRTVYVPAPPPVVQVTPAPGPQAPPPVVYVPAPAPQAPPPVVVLAPPEQPPVVVIQSETDFYEPLTAYGRWVVVGSYGRCWIPARVESGWRPYANGYWQRTDAGWYWVSEEPWGWATYHYGRWDFHAHHGWIWIPHTQWAPAWVAWREGGGYVGWAPLRPSVTFGVNIGVADYEPAFASRAFVFVEHRRMLEPVRPKTVIVNNTTIINKTVNITHVKVVNKTVINEGPRPEVIERASGRKVQSVPVREFRNREETAVATRERRIPTARDRRAESPSHPASEAVKQESVPPPVTRPVERPAQVVTQPPRPVVAPVRPTTSPRPEMDKPARDEKKLENGIVKKATTTPPTVEPKARPVARPPQAVAPGRDLRPVQKPAVAVKPTPPPVTSAPVIREDRKQETAIEKKNAATPPAVVPRPRQEVRPETRPASKRPVKTETAPADAVKSQIAPPAERPVEKRLISPREKSRAAEQGEANKEKKEDKRPKKNI